MAVALLAEEAQRSLSERIGAWQERRDVAALSGAKASVIRDECLLVARSDRREDVVDERHVALRVEQEPIAEEVGIAGGETASQVQALRANGAARGAQRRPGLDRDVPAGLQVLPSVAVLVFEQRAADIDRRAERA